MKEFIINYTPTGMIPTKGKVPTLPVNPDEIINDVLKAKQFGISMVHLHARNESGKPTWSKEIYKEIIDGIRSEDGYGNNSLIICVSTSGRNWSDFDKRSECLELEGHSKPDMASLTLGSLNFPSSASLNSPDTIIKLALKMKSAGIKPELEIFDTGMINYAKYLVRKEIIQPPFYFNLIFGNISTAQPGMLEFGSMINQLPQQSTWSAGGIGLCQLDMNVCGLLNGGGVRIGLEDNIFMDSNKQVVATNLDLLDRISKIALLMGYKPYKPMAVRKMLNLEI